MSPRVSVVIPAHNAAETLRAQLDAVRSQSCAEPFEIVVVDNASTDATPDLLAEVAALDARVRCIRATDARGPSYARNVGVAAAAGDIIVCCDADDIVADGWLAAMVAALARAEIVAGVLAVDELNDTTIVAARGGLVNEADLKAALESGQVAAAALDVFEKEPATEHPLFGMEQVIATPHLAGLTPQAIEHQSLETVAQAAEILAGRAPKGAVNSDHATRLKGRK